jgi:hypothetical protein
MTEGGSQTSASFGLQGGGMEKSIASGEENPGVRFSFNYPRKFLKNLIHTILWVAKNIEIINFVNRLQFLSPGHRDWVQSKFALSHVT